MIISRGRRAGAVVTVLLSLTACSVGINNSQRHSASGTPTSGASTKSAGSLLTPAPLGQVGQTTIDGTTRGSLTPTAAARYNASGGAAQVTVENNGAQTAFADLCNGSLDLVDSSIPISAAQLDQCHRYGLQVVQFSIASDAIVLAIKAETDVGGDCLTVSQVNNIYRAGSPVVSWSDLGFDNVPLTPVGPDRSNNAFDFFGRQVLGAPDPSMTYLRSDYVAQPDDELTREYITGTAADASTAADLSYYQTLASQKQAAVVEAADAVSTAQANETVAQSERTKGIVTKRPATTQAKDQARLVAAKATLAAAILNLHKLQSQTSVVKKSAALAVAATQREASLRGRVAYFRFTYYELFEEQLRPFEVSATSKPLNCIFPSEATIDSGQYPLGRRLLITTTTRSLGRHEVQDFLTSYLSNAQADATAARLLPLSSATVAQEKAWVNGTSAPLIVTSATLDNPSGPGPAK